MAQGNRDGSTSTATVEAGPPAQACLFLGAGQPFAIDVRLAREVVDFEAYTRVPGAPAAVLGVANLRGLVVPLLDPQPLLGLPPREPGCPLTALVVQDETMQVAFAIDDAVGLEPACELAPLGDVARAAYGDLAIGFVRWGERFVPFLDGHRVIAALRSGVAAALPAGTGRTGESGDVIAAGLASPLTEEGS